jgi:D-sedoheptulose 7-phosphate isomerase
MNIKQLLTKNIKKFNYCQAKMLSDQNLMTEFSRAAAKVIKCYQVGSRLYIAGNSGSVADAQHLAAEFISKLASDRPPAKALT